MSKLPYHLYMAEAEGLLDTHYTRVTHLIEDLKKYEAAGRNEFTITDWYLRKFGLTQESMTESDWRRIRKAFNADT